MRAEEVGPMTRLTSWRVVVALLAAAALIAPGAVSGGATTDERAPTSAIAADVTTGGGASFMRVAVTRHGNLLFESPKGVQMTAFDEGYAFCEGSDEAFAYDMPIDEDEVPGLNGEAGLAAASVTQPKPGKFPLTIERRTLDGRLRLTQTWAAPDANEKDVTVTMTVRNVGSTTVRELSLMRSAASHSRIGETEPFFGIATTADSVFQWWETLADTHGLVISARSVGKPHVAGVPTDIDIPLVCGADPSTMPDGLIDGGYPQITYEIGTLAPRAEATVVFVYRRL
jgi:hypothetical protein